MTAHSWLVELWHAWLHSCVYDTLYHSGRNDRDKEYEWDRGIKQMTVHLTLWLMCVCVWQVYFYYYHISNLLVTANSSVNFVVYCVFRRQFRRRLYACCCPSRLAKRQSSSTATEFHPLHTSNTPAPANTATSGNAHQLPVILIKPSWPDTAEDVWSMHLITEVRSNFNMRRRSSTVDLIKPVVL